ncbi:MAG TPA: hypothetical protein VH061_01380 [Solirubrobacteraceae bacterium]|jgi:hypothetical protein|nr:hypothetical protein [Solirubrobacteraceae bacterium]
MLKRRLALAVAALALLAGGTAVALGTTGSGHGGRAGHRHAHDGARHGLLAVASGYLGIPASQIRSEIASGKTLAQIAAATPGKSEEGLVSALVAAGKQRLQSASTKLNERIQALVQGKPGEFQHHRLGAARRHNSLRAAAVAYLGIERKALAADLRSGKTLAEVADATPGKSSAGLSQALLETATKRLDERASAVHLSKTAEATRVARLKTRLQSVLSRSHIGLHAHHAPTG